MDRYFEEHVVLMEAVRKDAALLGALREAVDVITACLRQGGRILIAGNGGSAADAQHFSAELVGRFLIKERKAYAALALTTDTSLLTAWSNDRSYEDVFSRQIEAHGHKGDVFIGISTSGDSSNLIEAVKMAKETELQSICLLGKGGGKLKDRCDISLIVPSDSTPRTQEVHRLLLHIISEEVENRLN